MGKDKQLFTHESVDDDIDQLIKNSSSLSSDLDAQFVYELHNIYKEDADSLKRVWKRLERHSKLQQTFQEPNPQTSQRRATILHGVPFKRNKRNLQYPARQLFTVLAATIIGIFLVSSLAWVLAFTHPTTPGATGDNLSNFVVLTVHNDTSGQKNYITLTGSKSNPNASAYCQPVPPLDWVDVESSPGIPAKTPFGQAIWLQYFHSPTCDASSNFMSVILHIPTKPVYNHCWFNPDNITTPNWSGCVNPSQTLPIDS